MRRWALRTYAIFGFAVVFLLSLGVESFPLAFEWEKGTLLPGPAQPPLAQTHDRFGSRTPTSTISLFQETTTRNGKGHIRDVSAHSGNSYFLSGSEDAEGISLSTLLAHAQEFHGKKVRLRGTVAQPELHVSETGLFIDFVFLLKEGQQTLVVFGRHDRTRGDIQISMGRSVEVVGVFWKERVSHGQRLENNLEALQVTFFPPLSPDQARGALEGLKEKPGENA